MLYLLIGVALLWVFFPQSAAKNPYAVIAGVAALIVVLAAILGN